MALPAKPHQGLLLVFLNGVKQSAKDDYAIEGSYISFAARLLKEDKISIVAMSPQETVEFEVELPYSYQVWEWFDPSNPHDPKVKKIDAPAAKVTQL